MTGGPEAEWWGLCCLRVGYRPLVSTVADLLTTCRAALLTRRVSRGAAAEALRTGLPYSSQLPMSGQK